MKFQIVSLSFFPFFFQLIIIHFCIHFQHEPSISYLQKNIERQKLLEQADFGSREWHIKLLELNKELMGKTRDLVCENKIIEYKKLRLKSGLGQRAQVTPELQRQFQRDFEPKSDEEKKSVTEGAAANVSTLMENYYGKSFFFFTLKQSNSLLIFFLSFQPCCLRPKIHFQTSNSTTQKAVCAGTKSFELPKGSCTLLSTTANHLQQTI